MIQKDKVHVKYEGEENFEEGIWINNWAKGLKNQKQPRSGGIM
jgi:hypothetical protein